MRHSLENVKTPCGIPVFSGTCSLTTPRVPVCNEACRRRMVYNNDNTVNLIDVFEISDILVREKLITVQATGWCMFPVIRRGDTLTIEPSKAEDMMIGDIALYRRAGAIYSHRVIRKVTKGGSCFIITMADTTATVQDGPIGNEDLLGKVTSIVRGKKVFDTIRRGLSVTEKIEYFLLRLQKKLSTPIMTMKRKVRFYATFLFDRLRQNQVIRMFLYILFGVVRSNMTVYMISYILRETAVSEDFVNIKDVADEVVSKIKDSYNMRFIAKISKVPIGHAYFIKRPDSCPYNGYWIEKFHIRGSFRGAAIGTYFWKELERFLVKTGVENVRIALVKDDGIAIRFFESLGFKKDRSWGAMEIYKRAIAYN